MKKPFFLLFLFCCFYSSLLSSHTYPKLYSKSAILMDMETGRVLYEKNSQKVFCPASITKLSSAVYALNKSGGVHSRKLIADRDTVGSVTKKFVLENNYRYPPHWLVLGGTHMHIHFGEELRFKDLLYGMLLESANDASNVIAKHTSGSVPQFMNELNKYLKKIGCKNTHFRNPHGMHLPGHQTCAYDMALVAREAFKNPELCKILKTRQYIVPKTNKRGPRKLINHNKLINTKSPYFYPYAIGGKTGFHDNSKNTIIAAAKKGDKTLIVVLLHAPTKNRRYEDTIRLFEYGFKNFK